MLNPFKANDSLDEVVFANRNKAYGAYAIRKSYDAQVTRSLGIVFGSFLALFLLSFLFPKNDLPLPVHEAPEEIVKIIEVDLSRMQQQAAAGVAPQAAASSHQTNTDNYRITNEQVTTPTPVSNPVTTGPVNTSTPAGTGNNTNIAVTNGPATNLPTTTTPDKIADITMLPEIMPDFGSGNLYEYLRKEITYPEGAIRAGVQGKVVVVFDVMADGTITNIKVEKGIGFGCDEEAIRVIKNMPLWKPGKQNGKAVPVRMRLPIKFETE